MVATRSTSLKPKAPYLWLANKADKGKKMEENRTHDTDERHAKSRTPEIGQTPVTQEGALAAGLESPGFQLATLIHDPNLSGRGNGETRAEAMHAAQRTYGNRALQRFVQGSTHSQPPSTRIGSLPVQRILGLDWATDALSGAWDWVKEKGAAAADWMKERGEDKAFDDIATGGVKTKDAPTEIKIPKELKEGMDKAWKGSFPGGKDQEQGGILVKDPKGEYVWKEGKPLPLDKGGSDMFSPDYKSIPKDETIVGVGHTHPYKSGATNVSFSGGDLASFIYAPERMQMVKSGEGEFVSARTAEFEKRLEGLDDKGKKKLHAEMEKEWDTIYNNPKDKRPIAERARDATMSVSKKYDLLYYEGKDGELSLK